MIPAVLVAAMAFNPTSTLVISQVVLSFVLPLPVITLIMFTRRRDLMGSLVNKPITTWAAIACSVLILALNLWLLYSTFLPLFRSRFPASPAVLCSKEGEYGFLGIFVSAFGGPFLFNMVDWLILDWLIFCTFTPRFAVLPGTEGMAGYKNYAMHFRGFLIGTIYSAGIGVVIAVLVTFV